ncbi:MAG: hypothetical protein RJA57_1915, partial [Bacteroidota bacterium]
VYLILIGFHQFAEGGLIAGTKGLYERAFFQEKYTAI